MSEKDEFAEGNAVCSEIGSAVLEVLGEKREFTVQSLIDALQKTRQDGHGCEGTREKSLEQAIRLLQKFA